MIQVGREASPTSCSEQPPMSSELVVQSFVKSVLEISTKRDLTATLYPALMFNNSCSVFLHPVYPVTNSPVSNHDRCLSISCKHCWSPPHRHWGANTCPKFLLLLAGPDTSQSLFLQGECSSSLSIASIEFFPAKSFLDVLPYFLALFSLLLRLKKKKRVERKGKGREGQE